MVAAAGIALRKNQVPVVKTKMYCRLNPYNKKRPTIHYIAALKKIEPLEYLIL